jgi:hypothetical protein
MFGLKTYKTLTHGQKAKRNLVGFIGFMCLAVFGYFVFGEEFDSQILGGFCMFQGGIYMLYYSIIGPINYYKSKKAISGGQV